MTNGCIQKSIVFRVELKEQASNLLKKYCKRYTVKRSSARK